MRSKNAYNYCQVIIWEASDRFEWAYTCAKCITAEKKRTEIETMAYILSDMPTPTHC